MKTEPSPKPLAEWTRNERVEYLATEVMGWRKEYAEKSDGVTMRPNWLWVGEEHEESPLWNPLTDWNHARMVEEKVMENQQLLSDYIWKITENIDRDPKNPASTEAEIIWCMLQADLPTRCDALIAAHQSLLTP